MEDGTAYTMASCKERDSEEILCILWIRERVILMLSAAVDAEMKALFQENPKIDMNVNIFVDDSVVDTVLFSIQQVNEENFGAPMSKPFSQTLLEQML